MPRFIFIVLLVWLPAFTRAAGLNIPRLDWQPRSDWINVRQDVHPAAVGDGTNDDTAAIQSALNLGTNGRTIYLPPGDYRITQTLVFSGPGVGSAIIGHGRDTRLIWDGAEGGRMFWSDGIAYSRYVGLTWDGRGRAAVGFDHAAVRRFETEIDHVDEAFRNFTGYGIRVGCQQKQASAEIIYHNCLFENCGTAIALLDFNDYDNTVDGCEFRNCGTGIQTIKSNFYARNCHFQNTLGADFEINVEHGCSIRRCTSEGSQCFVRERSTIAPLVLQDCQVAMWRDPVAAVYLAGPALMMDCSFRRPPSAAAPVRLTNRRQAVLVSGNEPALVQELVGGDATNQVLVIPAGPVRGAVVTSASEHFLQTVENVSGRVFDAVRDFGARGDGQADDTTAIQSAIDAAREHGQGATAYLPAGRYDVARTLAVTGANYRVEGGGFRCGLVWRGKAGAPFIAVRGVENVTLADFAVGMHDLGQMTHGDDILITSPNGRPCRLALEDVFAFGMYDAAPDKHGLHLQGLLAGSVVVADHVQGNVRITDCARAQLLFRTSYEGTVTIDGSAVPRDGLIGFLTRLTTKSHPALRVFDNQSVVMSDFYVEQSDQVAVISGKAGQPPGAVTLQGPKVHLLTEEPVLDIHDYAGRIYYQSQFYIGPTSTRFRSDGDRPLQLLLAGGFWYHSQPVFDLNPATALTLLGNGGNPEAVADTTVTPAARDDLSAALDDLRRLGRLDDAWSNHPR